MCISLGKDRFGATFAAEPFGADLRDLSATARRGHDISADAAPHSGPGRKRGQPTTGRSAICAGSTPTMARRSDRSYCATPCGGNSTSRRRSTTWLILTHGPIRRTPSAAKWRTQSASAAALGLCGQCRNGNVVQHDDRRVGRYLASDATSARAALQCNNVHL